MQCLHINRRLTEVASWIVVSELLRRYPTKFRVVETHPCGGMYDCLTLYDVDRRESIADFNWAGRFHVFRRLDGSASLPEPLDIWPMMISANSPKDVLDEVSAMLGLPVPTRLPASTPATLVYRFIATLLRLSVFGVEEWQCRNGFHDTAAAESFRLDAFSKFPLAQERLQIALPDDVLGQPAYRFWFIFREDSPVLCLEMTGIVWTANGAEYDLSHLYQRDRRIWPMITAVCRDLLP